MEPASSKPIDFSFRPETYSPDLCPELSLAGRVRGTWRRFAIQQAFDQGTVHELSPRIFEDRLPHAEIKAMEEGPNPRHVSGERLPCLEANEVEVARIICWAIKKAPVIALYAKPDAERRGYLLRFVNEFDREIGGYPRHITRPLSLGGLLTIIAHARLGQTAPQGLVWYLALGCERRGWPADMLKKGIYPVSGYYPDLRRYYCQAFEEWAQRGGLQQAFQISSSSTSTSTTNSSNL